MEIPYSVFLSFNKEDTGRTFVSHLCRWLDKRRIRTYLDEDQQARDGRRPSKVAMAIYQVDVIVVVISENYASSVRCLNVLAEIVEHSLFRRDPKTISTVFYEVDPGDLTRSNGKFVDDLRRHEERETPENVTRWRSALEHVDRKADPRFCSRNR
ncbi:hypothetical protein F2Q68_00008925 [Brassica cretica]|uniref:ADP-ribosyl cyclase/cyclic ADP-ribose hydrolase n=1 Tax=Brassica cretica TaxID=69181 RepID=A0A3N6T4M0_BRACR|nr:hypothetical protein F2Q68_00008925 [Brassica cretica]